ncbi:restriction endonuclease subunit S [Gallibacterium anatis]|uniref:restriction endonuclease subunit S n=1 Tax=Gallibacterium anatis TaxID=750 RepID=UPI00254CF1B4|nr:restriction endonuclease subunit S [Gallibacterium anatis]WIM85685.1 restriction endonuclease subunit S [Gallibacterium anatis]
MNLKTSSHLSKHLNGFFTAQNPYAWEKCKLGEIATINPKSTLPQTFNYVDLESVVGTEMRSYKIEKLYSAPSRAQRLAKYGDIFYQTVRPYQKNNYLFELDDENYVFSTGYAQIRSKIYPYFLFTLIQNDRFVNEVLDNCTGTSYPAINAIDLKNITIFISNNPTEQQKIGNLFKQLDRLITLHKRKLLEKYNKNNTKFLQNVTHQQSVLKFCCITFNPIIERTSLCN